MKARDRQVADTIRRCHAGLDTSALLDELLLRLAKVIPLAAGLSAVTDPSTLLYSRAAVTDPSHLRYHPAFIANEYLEHDVMKYVDLARGPRRINWLSRATRGHPDSSSRHRNLLTPMGLGDELRAAFVAGGSCWGVTCMTREAGSARFAEQDARVLSRIAPHIAEALRTSLLLAEASNRPDSNGPGVLILAEDLSVLGATPSAERWLEEVASEQEIRQKALPSSVLSVVAVLRSLDTPHAASEMQPRIRVRSRNGRWLVLHASYLAAAHMASSVAVVIEPARRAELAPLLLQAHGLTAKESDVARLVLLGRSTKEISRALFISEHTVQDHFKAIFNKVGVGSRRELVIRILSDQDPTFARSLSSLPDQK